MVASQILKSEDQTKFMPQDDARDVQSKPRITPFPQKTPADHEDRLNAPQRLAALEATGLMDSLPEEAFDRTIRLATKMTGASVGLFSIVDGQRQSFKAKTGLDVRQEHAAGTPLSHSFCQYVVSQDEPLGVDDARIHPLLSTNQAPEELGVVAYLGVPIHSPDGQVLGSFCAIETTPRAWTSSDLEALEDIARMLESEIALRRSADECALLVDELKHRVKNLFAIISSMIRLGKSRADTVGDLAEALNARVKALGHAYDLIAPVSGGQRGQGRGATISALLEALLAPYVDIQDECLSMGGPTVELGAFATTNLALVFHEFSTNAAKYGALAEPDGALTITWEVADETLRVLWRECVSKPLETDTSEPGFGSRLTDVCLQGQLQGSYATEAAPTGWTYHIKIPVRVLKG